MKQKHFPFVRSYILALALLHWLSGQLATAQTCPSAPSSNESDCNNNGVADRCDRGNTTFVLFDGGLIGVPSNDCQNNTIPDDCENNCYGSTTGGDADGDGVSNCQEQWDETDPCDGGSRIQRLDPVACGSPNGFFQQINIATVINTSFANLAVSAIYYSSDGIRQGSVANTLQPAQKWDIIVNDLGLKPDTYGTVCITTNGNVQGLWSGGLSIYKLRELDSAFGENAIFDYALYYPFKNPDRGNSVVPINTFFPLNPKAEGLVANWIRLIDAVPGDGKSLTGALNFYDQQGKLLQSVPVAIRNGGRSDFGGHEYFSANSVGLAAFIPSQPDLPYYIEATRYFYEGKGSVSNHFYTAFPLPIQPLTGEARAIALNPSSNEFAVVELLNGTSSPLASNDSAQLELRAADGTILTGSGAVAVPAKGTLHVVAPAAGVSTTPTTWTRAAGPHESLNETALTYGFDRNGGLEYGYAIPLIESPGPRQVTEFNTFISHENTLKLINDSDQSITVDFSIFDFNHAPLPLPPELTSPTLAPHEFRQVDLVTLPKNSYGTISAKVRSGKVGLIMLNNITRDSAYVMPFVAR